LAQPPDQPPRRKQIERPKQQMQRRRDSGEPGDI
jgi:hypothetical protein